MTTGRSSRPSSRGMMRDNPRSDSPSEMSSGSHSAAEYGRPIHPSQYVVSPPPLAPNRLFHPKSSYGTIEPLQTGMDSAGGPHSASATTGTRQRLYDDMEAPSRSVSTPSPHPADAAPSKPITYQTGQDRMQYGSPKAGPSSLRVVTSSSAGSSSRDISPSHSPSSPTKPSHLLYGVPSGSSENSHQSHSRNEYPNAPNLSSTYLPQSGANSPKRRFQNPSQDFSQPSGPSVPGPSRSPGPQQNVSLPRDPSEKYPEVPTPRASGSNIAQPTPTPGQVIPGSLCGHCGKPVKGQFVRAMGRVFHLDCFRCKDCNIIVAAKFFPVDDVDGSYPLCERDYFARLDLICGKCDKALRGSYITACCTQEILEPPLCATQLKMIPVRRTAKKFHVEHFTCSVCTTLFGPQDSYYEHGDDVYCHFHYSTRFAVKCVGCANAILKQFVEINRNQKDECWHPECYMIHKFWNVKLTSKLPSTPSGSRDASTASSFIDINAVDEEQRETAETLRAKQQRMEVQVESIWKVLSAFEESSAACISEMLRFVSTGQYLEAVIMAERFILHVEILFAAIDDLEAQFALENVKGMSHAREAKMLCRKTVNFFSLLSHTQDPPEQRAMITQELLALVTGLAHYLKILIRIALTGSLKLEREHGNVKALDFLLARLSLLARDDSNPNLQKRGETVVPEKAAIEIPPGYTPSTVGLAYGYRSLAMETAGESVLHSNPGLGQHLDLCIHCHKSVEEDCVRLGLSQRWHSYCLRCSFCDRAAGVIAPKEDKHLGDDSKPRAFVRRIAPLANEFLYEPLSIPNSDAAAAKTVVCVNHPTRESIPGFEVVSRLEQYAFLLNVALRRLYDHLSSQGVVKPLPLVTNGAATLYGAYRDSTEIKRLKSVNLDRKLSATARIPQRSTVVESPSGKVANSDVLGALAKSPEPFRSRQTTPGPPDMSRGPAGSSRRASPEGERSETSALDSPLAEEHPGASHVAVIRPPFARNNTQVCIVNDTQGNTPEDRLTPRAGYDDHSPFADEEGVTLADLPLLMEAEQARLERRHTPLRDGKPLISDLTTLESLIIKHFALLALQRSPLAPLIDVDELWDLVEVKKSGWWNKIFKGGKDKKDVKRKGTFGVPLEILVEKTGSDSQLGASNAQLRVPEFIDNVISAMKQMDMSVEGIFRKNGNIKRLNNVAEALDRDVTSVNLSDDNPVQLAALLKKFLRDLPDPLMTYRLHRLFCAAQNLQPDSEKQRCLHLLVCLLPRCNRDTMEVLFVFLRWVASFSHVDEETGSRMDIANLATVICPSILYSKGNNAMKDDSFTAIKAVQSLVEDQETYYTIPDELQFVLDENVSALFANSIDLPPKEIQKHCSNYLSARRGQGPRPSGSGGSQTIINGSGNPLSTYRSDGNLSATAGSQANGKAPRPTSWVNGPGEAGFPYSPHPGLPHQPFSTLSSQSSPGSRRNFQGAESWRGSAPPSPSVSAAEEPRRPSSSAERVRSPIPPDLKPL